MKKAIRKVVLIFFIGSFFITLSFKKTRAVEPLEDPLTGVLADLGFTNIEETTQETFSPGQYVITLYAEFAGYHEQNELSRYRTETSDFIVLFEGLEGNLWYLSPPITKTFTADHEFGLSLLSQEARYFTETDRNPDNPTKHATVFKNLDNPNMFLIGLEDMLEGADNDYQDMIISLEQKPQTSVPEFGFEIPVIVSLCILAYLVTHRRKSK